ncbi:cerebellin-3-like [Saccostrea echinata]|uniref:cerebellin-3-like n=1 Tax=Saccostrea echinata TaxID=191078 RepID=UPI002A7F718D|nr:cerebellin-3-like [Saccostrea echinata]
MIFPKKWMFMLIIYSKFLVCTGDVFVSSDFKHQPRFDDVYLPTIHLITAYCSVTLLKCAVICKNVPGCSSVRYHVTERERHLLNFCLICNVGRVERGWRYFCQSQPPATLHDAPEEQIAFHTHSGDSMKGNGDLLIFDKILTNVGQGYNSTSGIFTCPSDGLYILLWSQQSRNHNQYTATYLFVRGQPVRKLRSRLGNLASDFVMIQLQTGDSVYVCSDYRSDSIGSSSQFSGWAYKEPEAIQHSVFGQQDRQFTRQ